MNFGKRTSWSDKSANTCKAIMEESRDVIFPSFSFSSDLFGSQRITNWKCLNCGKSTIERCKGCNRAFCSKECSVVGYERHNACIRILTIHTSEISFEGGDDRHWTQKPPSQCRPVNYLSRGFVGHTDQQRKTDGRRQSFAADRLRNRMPSASTLSSRSRNDGEDQDCYANQHQLHAGSNVDQRRPENNSNPKDESCPPCQDDRYQNKNEGGNSYKNQMANRHQFHPSGNVDQNWEEKHMKDEPRSQYGERRYQNKGDELRYRNREIKNRDQFFASRNAYRDEGPSDELRRPYPASQRLLRNAYNSGGEIICDRINVNNRR